jgi:ABC-2 type transport system permease protein
MIWLIRREVWENRSLWIAPLVVAGIILVIAAFGGVHVGNGNDVSLGWDSGSGAHMSDQDRESIRSAMATAPLSKKQIIYAITLSTFTAVQLFTMIIVLFFYLLDSLLAERKDRSILFWKSLPVSDGLTVLSKFLVAVLVVPLGVLALAAVCHVLLFMVWQLGVATGRLPDVLTWSTLLWFKVEAVMLASLLLGALWYAPLAASFLLVSAWARRSPIMWVTLAPIVAMVVEWKIGTHYVANFLYYRSFGIWEILGASAHGERLEDGARLEAVLGNLNFAAAFTNLNLWLGVLATAALLYATVRVRRYRDDT